MDIGDTLPRPPRQREKRHPSRLERWAWSEIPAYRLGLTLGYAGTIYFGISAFIAGVPVFEITAPSGWTPIWSGILILGGILGSVGSIAETKRFRRIELVGSWAIFLTLSVYAASLLFIAYAVGDTSRAAVGSGFVGLAVPPGIRMLWLVTKAQLGRKSTGTSATGE